MADDLQIFDFFVVNSFLIQHDCGTWIVLVRQTRYMAILYHLRRFDDSTVGEKIDKWRSNDAILFRAGQFGKVTLCFTDPLEQAVSDSPTPLAPCP